MTDEQTELAKRAVDCKGWRWMPGMRTAEVLQPPPWTLPLWDEAVVIACGDGETAKVCTVLGKVRAIHRDALPDLTDPATLGCLLALVRQAWGPEGFLLPERGGGWIYYERLINSDYWRGNTEAEALVAALEAAPNTSGEHRREGKR